MKTLYASAAVLAISAAAAAAEEGYTSSVASDMATGYTSKAIDTVPGNGVGATGEQPEAEAGATADMGTSVNTDFGAEPEGNAQVGVDVDSITPDTTTPMVDPNETRTAAADDATSGASEGAATDAASQDVTLQGVVGEDTPSTEQFDSAQAESVVREGFEKMEVSDVSADDLTGAPVIDANDEQIGFVSELVVNMSGELTEAELALGGFLWGIGATEVLVSMDDLTIQRDMNDGDIEVVVDMTEDALMQRGS